MRRWSLSVPLVLLLVWGCARPAAPVPGPGDVVRPEVAFAPKEPWPAGAKVTIGMLVRVDRPEGEARYLLDGEVAPDLAVMTARVTFLNDGLPLGDSFDVPLVRDC